ncbi:MAG: K(+)-transporting ATPase subunit F [Verrucomicrobiota bacterium]|nr:K(+)-transporting ATPase subunit F [Verrucomicrobiota bacterium]
MHIFQMLLLFISAVLVIYLFATILWPERF